MHRGGERRAWLNMFSDSHCFFYISYDTVVSLVLKLDLFEEKKGIERVSEIKTLFGGNLLTALCVCTHTYIYIYIYMRLCTTRAGKDNKKSYGRVGVAQKDRVSH